MEEDTNNHEKQSNDQSTDFEKQSNDHSTDFPVSATPRTRSRSNSLATDSDAGFDMADIGTDFPSDMMMFMPPNMQVPSDCTDSLGQNWGQAPPEGDIAWVPVILPREGHGMAWHGMVDHSPTLQADFLTLPALDCENFHPPRVSGEGDWGQVPWSPTMIQSFGRPSWSWQQHGPPAAKAKTNSAADPKAINKEAMQDAVRAAKMAAAHHEDFLKMGGGKPMWWDGDEDESPRMATGEMSFCSAVDGFTQGDDMVKKFGAAYEQQRSGMSNSDNRDASLRQMPDRFGMSSQELNPDAAPFCSEQLNPHAPPFCSEQQLNADAQPFSPELVFDEYGNMLEHWSDDAFGTFASHNEEDKRVNKKCKDFLADYDREEPITTIMIHNIPGDLSRDMLTHYLNEGGFCGKYDFVHMPIDRGNRQNIGYAFVNFVHAKVAKDATMYVETHELFTKGSDRNAKSPSMGLRRLSPGQKAERGALSEDVITAFDSRMYKLGR